MALVHGNALRSQTGHSCHRGIRRSAICDCAAGDPVQAGAADSDDCGMDANHRHIAPDGTKWRELLWMSMLTPSRMFRGKYLAPRCMLREM